MKTGSLTKLKEELMSERLKGRRVRRKMKKCIALLDGKVLVDDVLQAALDCRVMLDDLKKRLVEENPGHEVTFVYR